MRPIHHYFLSPINQPPIYENNFNDDEDFIEIMFGRYGGVGHGGAGRGGIWYRGAGYRGHMEVKECATITFEGAQRLSNEGRSPIIQ